MFRAVNLYPFHRWGIRGPGTAEVHLGRNPGLTTCTASPPGKVDGDPEGSPYTPFPYLLLHLC